jgi:hypothetical protein
MKKFLFLLALTAIARNLSEKYKVKSACVKACANDRMQSTTH